MKKNNLTSCPTPMKLNWSTMFIKAGKPLADFKLVWIINKKNYAYEVNSVRIKSHLGR